MHKDAPPGVFDIGSHSTRYVISLGLVTGFAVSVMVFGVYAIATNRFNRNDPSWNATENSQMPAP